MILLVVTSEARGSSGWQPLVLIVFHMMQLLITNLTNFNGG